MATIKLVGSDDATSNSALGADQFAMNKFTAVANGNMVEFKIKMQANGNVKVGVYADSAGEPAALLASVGSTAAVTGWNTITIPSVSIVLGTDYWLAANQELTTKIGVRNDAGIYTMRFKTLAFANAFPDPAGTGYTNATDYMNIVAGWGSLPVIGGSDIHYFSEV